MARPRPTLRSIVLFLLWLAPTLLYVAVAVIAVYQTGWLGPLAIILPVLWLLAWAVAKLWKRDATAIDAQLPKFHRPEFWTDTDTQAIQVVEEYRKEILMDRNSIIQSERYIDDARVLAGRLSKHYHKSDSDEAFHPITLTELLSVIHLASEDIEQWVANNIPGSNYLTIGHFARVSDYARYLDNGQKLIFIASAIAKPMKLLFYPLWRRSGAVTDELQDEVAQVIYQQYLRTVGFYLIEMFSGRLRGGSREYRDRFGRWATAMHRSGGRKELMVSDTTQSITVAVMGQVKAGKSSLINALLRNQAAQTNILPQTRQVERYTYTTPTNLQVTLLDTPGYSEADVAARQRHEVEIASEAADIILLVMAANSPAKDADVRMVKDIAHYYRERQHLNPPKLLAVLTHIDQLRPVLEWDPPYNWRNPTRSKERSIADAVKYCQELFGDSVVDYVCVYTGDEAKDDDAVVDELVPMLLKHLEEGQATAVLKAFYDKLSAERVQKLKGQFAGLIRSIGSIITDRVTK